MVSMTTSRERLVEAARAVGEVVSGTAEQAEFKRKLSPEAVDALKAADLFDIMLPEALGGAEADPVTQALVFEEISRQDSSTGWCLMASATCTGSAGAYLSDSAVDEIFGNRRNVVMAGQAAPAGRLIDDGDEYSLSGHWQFGSGIAYADWVIAGCAIFDGETPKMAPGGMPEMRIACVRPEDAPMVDHWDVLGLQATGSHDYEATDVRVPRGFTFDLTTVEPLRGGPLYRMGLIGLVASGHAAVALGIGRRALDEVAAIARERQRMNQLIADRPTFQRDYAQAEASMQGARLLVLDALERAWQAVERGDGYGPRERAAVRLASTHATTVAADVTTFAYRAAGTVALRTPNALERCFRDIHAATQHGFVSENTYLEAAQVMLGTAPETVRL